MILLATYDKLRIHPPTCSFVPPTEKEVLARYNHDLLFNRTVNEVWRLLRGIDGQINMPRLPDIDFLDGDSDE